MKLSDFDYHLPPELIAQCPVPNRSSSRLLRVDKSGASAPRDHAFVDVVELLPPDSLLVLNETRVIPARFLGRRDTGGKVEVLLVEPRPDGDWEALVRCGGSLRADERIDLEDGRARLHLVERTAPGRYRVRFASGEDPQLVADRCGRMPLPPYIKREASPDDRDTYQTVFARVPGAIAAPTAGLHFTPELLGQVEASGVTIVRLTLHVGLGTFLPVRFDDVTEHVMHAERYIIPPATLDALEAARAAARPVVSCGTTAVRALEAWGQTGESAGSTDLFIRPPFEFRVVDGLLTNFHLPRSTLLMLVSALASREIILAAYEHAVKSGYRFYSYGDAMLIL